MTIILIVFFFFYFSEDQSITHMYETILNHNYPNGKWIKAMTTYLVWNIDGDEKYKIEQMIERNTRKVILLKKLKG